MKIISQTTTDKTIELYSELRNVLRNLELDSEWDLLKKINKILKKYKIYDELIISVEENKIRKLSKNLLNKFYGELLILKNESNIKT
jgi:hypothetical protein